MYQDDDIFYQLGLSRAKLLNPQIERWAWMGSITYFFVFTF
jgi:hypothetical protein